MPLVTPRGPDGERLCILHVDMDAFFAAIEQRDNPRLRGRPVVVGGSPFSRGVVSTASYEARRFGIRSAMPSRTAYNLCPRAVFVPPDHGKYARVSRQIRAVFERYTPEVEPLSLDEAFLYLPQGDAVSVGRAVKADIRRETRLTGSVGVSYCKFLAKLASDLEKPDGFTVVDAARARSLLPDLPVRKIWGVGPRSEEALAAFGIKTCGDLLRGDPQMLRRTFGRRADELLLLAQGVDLRRVEAHADVKSMSEETTFERDLDPLVPEERERLHAALAEFGRNLGEVLARRHMRARTVTVKIRWHDFESITRSQTFADATDDGGVIAQTGREILGRVEPGGKKVRLIGLGVCSLLKPGEFYQLKLPL